MLHRVVGAGDRELEEVEDAVEDGEEQSVEDLDKVGLRARVEHSTGQRVAQTLT